MKLKWKVTILIFALGLLIAAGAHAQGLVPPAGFGMIGFIQEATLDGTVAGKALIPLANSDPRAGGTLTINGIKMLVPNNTIVQMPAFALSWQQLFDPAFAAPVNNNNTANLPTGTQTGLALADTAMPFPSFEVTVVGNIIEDPVTQESIYIVGGLIAPVSQQGLNGSAGLINYIDYTTGRFRVGGIPNDPNTGALVEINDPIGRWGLAHSPDARFTTDTGNPTVQAANGYPVCIPRVAPPGIDPECPLTNRPPNPAVGVTTPFAHDPWLPVGAPLRTFNMPASAAPGTTVPDPWKQLPLVVGDMVDYAGTLYKLLPGDPNFNPLLPPNSPGNTYISAHTVEAELGVFTAAGVKPCYVRVEAILVPTAQVRNQPIVTAGNPPTPIPAENSTRVVVVGFTTDPTQLVDIYNIDVNPTTGAETLRRFATVLPEAIGGGRVRGRFRFTPSRSTGTFPATRECIAKSRTGQVVAANGLTTGQYLLPNFDFLFAERLTFGNPTVPNNFNQMPFLAVGSGPVALIDGSDGPVLGRLDPWPGP